ncbi:MAG: hypothetical protein GXO61_01440 [Epsilonproteobacteria bacterium]|nr:hypothetical protein [Campylobacterota bacterium]
MVRKIFPFLLVGVIQAETLKETIVDLIGQKKFDRNRLILNTLFSRSEKFRNSSILEIARVLKKLGLIERRYPYAVKQRFKLVSYDGSPAVVVKNAVDALYRASVFDYAIEKITNEGDSTAVTLGFKSAKVFDLIEAGKNLEKNGVKVLKIVREDKDWTFYVEAEKAILNALNPLGQRRIDRIKRPLWIRVDGTQEILLRSHSNNHWHPKIFVYSRSLRPLRKIEHPQEMKSLRLTLSDEDFYLKVSDAFFIGNLKNGLDVIAEGKGY